MRLLLFFLLLAGPLPAAETWTYWIEPCAAATARDSGCHSKDTELAVWALQAWRTASDSQIALLPATEESKARLRLRWVSGNSHLYGETRPFLLNGQKGAEVYVLPSVAGSDDPLLREAIVYLTCLHELGHAFGLPHTRNFADIMYSFQFGGDIPEYFGRYRRTIQKRDDIQHSSGISPTDREALRELLKVVALP